MTQFEIDERNKDRMAEECFYGGIATWNGRQFPYTASRQGSILGLVPGTAHKTAKALNLTVRTNLLTNGEPIEGDRITTEDGLLWMIQSIEKSADKISKKWICIDNDSDVHG